jgi:ABC-type maltose transport system permease subunit
MKTMTFYMNTMVNASNSVAGQGIAAAASLIMFIPNLILFIICQNAVMNTMATSGIK